MPVFTGCVGAPHLGASRVEAARWRGLLSATGSAVSSGSDDSAGAFVFFLPAVLSIGILPVASGVGGLGGTCLALTAILAGIHAVRSVRAYSENIDRFAERAAPQAVGPAAVAGQSFLSSGAGELRKNPSFFGVLRDRRCVIPGVTQGWHAVKNNVKNAAPVLK